MVPPHLTWDKEKLIDEVKLSIKILLDSPFKERKLSKSPSFTFLFAKVTT
jgi:hypothetical protein